MKKSVLSSAGSALLGVAVAAVLVFASGCEWESSGSEGSWNDSMTGWVNFSGMYRSATAGRALVENFTLGPGGGTDSEFLEFVFNNQAGPLQPAPFTVFNGVINYLNKGISGWSLKPGSVSVSIEGTITGPTGSFTDDGSGGLSGTFSQVPGSTPYNGTGTIDYDTGAWSLTLEQPFIEPAQVAYSYVVQQQIAGSSTPVPSTPDDTPPTGQEWVMALHVEQTGNRLRFTDNRGFTWDGAISRVAVANGDMSGLSSGDVSAVFEVYGTSSRAHKIVGSFSGSYAAGDAAEGTTRGTLSSRRIQGVWMEPSGRGDLNGVTDNIGTTATAEAN